MKVSIKQRWRSNEIFVVRSTKVEVGNILILVETNSIFHLFLSYVKELRVRGEAPGKFKILIKFKHFHIAIAWPGHRRTQKSGGPIVSLTCAG